MKVLGIIPARGGSKGVPGKNAKLLGKKPLIQYTVEAALMSKRLNKILVSTDSLAIIDITRKLGIEAPFRRPESLAQDHTPTLPVVQHALQWLKKERNEFFDAVCLLQPTNPFRPFGFIDQAIEKFIESKADSLISVLPLPHQYNPHWVFEPDVNGFLRIATGEQKLIARRQELPSAYFRDGSIYLTLSHIILNKNSLYGEKIAYITSNYNSYVNIDTSEDWIKAEKMLKHFYF